MLESEIWVEEVLCEMFEVEGLVTGLLLEMVVVVVGIVVRVVMGLFM
jgi:hypothetical protein